VIHNSPSKVYHYALPFSPSSSWLRECYSSELSQEVNVVKGLQVDWGTCYRTVSFDRYLITLAYWKEIIAVGSGSGDIIILNAITGTQTSALSGHTGYVRSLTFSQDGIFLVSGGNDETIKFWDIQTGGIVKTFHGHTGCVYSVSISPDNAIIASGSIDGTIRLWDAKTGECHCCVIDGHNNWVNSVSFSPANSQLLISGSSDYTVQQWDINGHQIRPTYEGCYIAFSLDGTQFISWGEQVATVRDSDSGAVIARLQAPSNSFQCCCLSPDGKYVAGGTGHTIYIWDITCPYPHLIETFIGHTRDITSLKFSSSLIPPSYDRSIKFWQISASSMDPKSTPPTSASITSVTLHANDGIAISSDSTGVVRIWDILSGLCKATLHTPAQNFDRGDLQLIGSRFIFVWYESEKVYIWDTEKEESQMLVISTIP